LSETTPIAPPSPRGPLARCITRVLDRVEGLVGVLLPERWSRRGLAERLRVDRIPLALPGAGAGLAGLRILLVTDCHAGPFFGPGHARLLAARAAPLEPDLVLLGGDNINNHAGQTAALVPFIEGLDPPRGFYAVTGNHEHLNAEPGPCTERLAAAGVKVLRNTGVRISCGGSGFWLAGVDDAGEGRPDLAKALVGAEPGEPVILLSHQPDFFPLAVAAGVAVQLSGHTHAGQIRIGGWAPMTHTRHGFLHGRYERQGARLHVSAGVGTTLLPLRIGTRPELLLFEVESCHY